MKIKTIWVKGHFDCPITHYSQCYHTNTLTCRFKTLHMSHLYFPTTNISANVYFSQLLRSYFIALSVWRAFWTKSVKFSGESQTKAHARLTANMDIFHGFLIFTDGDYMWNVSYAFMKRAHSSKQHVSVSGTHSLSVRAALTETI